MTDKSECLAARPRPARGRPSAQAHPSLFEPTTLILITVLCIFGAIIGMQLLVSLGITANTSLIGALAAMALARVPLAALARYRSIHVQNLAQSAISSATFGAGNSLLLPIGIPFVLGRPDLVLPMFAGVFLAMLLDAYLLYRMFDSKVFPATGAWPPGVAAAEAIKAGDEGGRKAVLMGIGVAVGVVGVLVQDSDVGLRRRLHRQYLGAVDVRHRPAAPRLLDDDLQHAAVLVRSFRAAIS